MRLIQTNLLLACAYGATGWLLVQLPQIGYEVPFLDVPFLWPPIGIATAAFVMLGPRVAPGVALGAFTVAVARSGNPVLVMPIAFGDTLGPLLAATVLVRRFAFRPQLDRYQDVLLFVAVAVLGCSLVTASIRSVSLIAAGTIAWSQWPSVWAGWLAGDAAGVLVVGTPLLTWSSPSAAPARARRSAIEVTALVLTLAAATAIMLWNGDRVPSLAQLAFPGVLWAALRFGPRGASAATLAVSSAAISSVAADVGPFAEPLARYGMISLWVFITLTAASALLVTALLAERNQVLQQKDRIMHELDHRVKNTLATVLAVAEQSRSSATDVASYVDTFAGRVRALAVTHEALARSDWRGVALDEVVQMVLAPFGFGKVASGAAGGDPLVLPAQVTAALTMTLHELATNAAKYGAWSMPGGSVTVTWRVEPRGSVRLVWTERGGPTTTAPASHGFGLRVIERLISYELGGAVVLDFREAGLVCTVDLPTAARA